MFTKSGFVTILKVTKSGFDCIMKISFPWDTIGNASKWIWKDVLTQACVLLNTQCEGGGDAKIVLLLTLSTGWGHSDASPAAIVAAAAQIRVPSKAMF